MDHPWNYLVAALIIAVILAYLVLVLAALVSVLRSANSGGMKVVWFVFIWVAPFLGSLLWFVIGKPNARPAPQPRY
ncbi:PLDc_N domain-containing protein [Amycolatopsis acidicola]|uniref:PLDc_N domain-containing protein n=1 Tax=Amycolatopsis acidicola TaxID=2596893 RepID=A0A5N0V1D7_9PSEU|nr:PLD nuclease N-terminal domain-containing protein [Amycolatopsis acidicola]KAA9158109.1 PLDc_N domain-containing protein [Amycolatopsis acidicola]